jgi:hypothetical protein
MNWFAILKLRGDVNVSMRHPTIRGAVAGQYIPEHEDPELSHSVNVFLGGVGRILEMKYEMEQGRKPTDREYEEAFKETLTHEAGHAAHHNIDPKRFDSAASKDGMDLRTAKTRFEDELVAFVTQYKDRVYEIYLHLASHPHAAQEAKVFHPAMKWAQRVIPNNYNYRRLFGNKWGADLVTAARNKVLLLYLQKVKTTTDIGVFTDLTMSQVPRSKKEAVELFGPKNEEFSRSLRLPAVSPRRRT